MPILLLALLQTAQAQTLPESAEAAAAQAAAETLDAGVGAWTLLLFVALSLGAGLLALRRWVSLELTPLLDRLHRAASAWESRTPQPQLQRWRPPGPVAPLRLPRFDAPWTGALHVCAGPGAIEPLVESALQSTGLVVSLAALPAPTLRLNPSLAGGRVFLCEDASVVGAGLGPFVEAALAQGSPALVIFDLRAGLGGADPVAVAAAIGRRLADRPAGEPVYHLALLPPSADLARLAPAAGLGERVRADG